MSEREFDNFNFSENEIVPLNVKTEGSSVKYSINEEDLATNEEIDTFARTALKLMGVVMLLLPIIIYLIYLFD